jgi:hypothetical protein
MKDKFNVQVLRNADAGENAKPKSATVKLHWYCAILNATVALSQQGLNSNLVFFKKIVINLFSILIDYFVVF